MLVRNHSLREYLLIYSEGGGGIYMCKNNSGCFFLHCKAYKINFRLLLKIARCIHSSGPLFFISINIFLYVFSWKIYFSPEACKPRQDVPQLHFKTSQIDEIDNVSMQIYVNEGFSYLWTKLRLKTKLKSNFNTNKITSFLSENTR